MNEDTTEGVIQGRGDGQRRRILLAVSVVALCLVLMLLFAHRHRPAVHRPPRVAPVAVVDDGPPGIVIHDSDTPGRIKGGLMDEKRLEEIHAKDHPDWAITYEGKTYHIGYHYVIPVNGHIQQGRPDLCIGAHCRTHNDWIGICVIGAFSTNRHWWPESPTKAQTHALIVLCERLMSKYHIPPKYVKRHRDLNWTYCPGDRFPYHFVMQQLESYAATHPETQPLTNRVVSLALPRPHQRRVYERRQTHLEKRL